MVLADLGRRITSALSDLSKSPVLDAAAIDALLKQVCAALLAADVNVRLVSRLRDAVRKDVADALNTNDKGQAERMTEVQRRNVVQKVRGCAAPAAARAVLIAALPGHL